MIYITHLYQATEMMRKLDPSYSVPPFDFESFPRLKDTFCDIENHLKRLVSGLRSEIDSKQKVSVLVKDLQKTIMGCKSLLHTLTDQFVGIEEKLKSVVEKKVKDLEKKEEQEMSPF